jgi:hypothetical protein
LLGCTTIAMATPDNLPTNRKKRNQNGWRGAVTVEASAVKTAAFIDVSLTFFRGQAMSCG